MTMAAKERDLHLLHHMVPLLQVSVQQTHPSCLALPLQSSKDSRAKVAAELAEKRGLQVQVRGAGRERGRQ
jgi:hypothetical protein